MHQNSNQDGNFFELTPDEWWNKKYSLIKRRNQSNMSSFSFEENSLQNDEDYFTPDYSSPNKSFIKEVNNWKKMTNLEKYNLLKKSKSYNIMLNKFESILKKKLFNQLEKLALEEKTSKKPKVKVKKTTVRKRKKTIPKSVKIAVWNKNIGEAIGKHKCLCCNITDITQMNFHCGHIIAEAKGGKVHVDNLLPICSKCNKSMGTQNLNEFKKKYFEK